MVGLYLGGFTGLGPLGRIVLSNIAVSNAGGACLYVGTPGSVAADVEFINVTLSNCATEAFSTFGHWPVEVDGGPLTFLAGVTVHDARPRPFLYGGWPHGFAQGVGGEVTVHASPYGCTPYYYNASASINNTLAVTCVPPQPGAQLSPAPVATAGRQAAPGGAGAANTAPYGDPARGCLPNETALVVPGVGAARGRTRFQFPPRAP